MGAAGSTNTAAFCSSASFSFQCPGRGDQPCSICTLTCRPGGSPGAEQLRSHPCSFPPLGLLCQAWQTPAAGWVLAFQLQASGLQHRRCFADAGLPCSRSLCSVHSSTCMGRDPGSLPRPGRTKQPLGDAPCSLGCICIPKHCCWMPKRMCPPNPPALSAADRASQSILPGSSPCDAVHGLGPSGSIASGQPSKAASLQTALR